MKVAICSSDGSQVDLHFGKTDTFTIYEFNDEKAFLIGKRKVEKFSHGDFYYLDDTKLHPFRAERFDRVFEAIKDCEMIYTVAIGNTPMKKLLEKGIKVQVGKSPIDGLSVHKKSSKIKYYLS